MSPSYRHKAALKTLYKLSKDIVTEKQKNPMQTGSHSLYFSALPAALTPGDMGTKDLSDAYGTVHMHEHCVCKYLEYTTWEKGTSTQICTCAYGLQVNPHTSNPLITFKVPHALQKTISSNMVLILAKSQPPSSGDDRPNSGGHTPCSVLQTGRSWDLPQ